MMLVSGSTKIPSVSADQALALYTAQKLVDIAAPINAATARAAAAAIAPAQAAVALVASNNAHAAQNARNTALAAVTAATDLSSIKMLDNVAGGYITDALGTIVLINTDPGTSASGYNSYTQTSFTYQNVYPSFVSQTVTANTISAVPTKNTGITVHVDGTVTIDSGATANWLTAFSGITQAVLIANAVYALKADGTVWYGAAGIAVYDINGNVTYGTGAIPLQLFGIPAIKKITGNATGTYIVMVGVDGTLWLRGGLLQTVGIYQDTAWQYPANYLVTDASAGDSNQTDYALRGALILLMSSTGIPHVLVPQFASIPFSRMVIRADVAIQGALSMADAQYASQVASADTALTNAVAWAAIEAPYSASQDMAAAVIESQHITDNYASIHPFSMPTQDITSWGMGAAIISSNDPSALGNPSRISEVVFDSWHYQYIAAVLVVDTVVVLPAIAPGSNVVASGPSLWSLIFGGGGPSYTAYPKQVNGTVDHLICGHGRSYTPYVLGFDMTNGKALSSGYVLTSGDSMRVLNLSVTGTQVFVSEQYSTYTSGLPQMQFNLRLLVLAQSVDTDAPPNDPHGWYADANRVILGGGKLDSLNNYIYKDEVNGARLPVSPQLDVGTSRIYPYGGASITLQSYVNGAPAAALPGGRALPALAGAGYSIGVGTA